MIPVAFSIVKGSKVLKIILIGGYKCLYFRYRLWYYEKQNKVHSEK